MKNLLFVIVFILVVASLSGQTFAEQPFKSAGVSAAFYKPKLDYLEDFLSSDGYAKSMDSGASMSLLSGEFNISGPVHARLSIGYWKKITRKHSIDPNFGHNAFRQFSLTLAPAVLDFIYTIDPLTDIINNTRLYVGGGVGMVYVRERLQRYTGERFYNLGAPQGTAFIKHALAGLEQQIFSSNFYYRLEADATFGYYKKIGSDVENGHDADAKVSLDGYKFSLGISYHFAQ